MAGDRLSDLPNDLLLRIFHFTPSKEAVSTGALSRRWRNLWRMSDAVNVESRYYRHRQGVFDIDFDFHWTKHMTSICDSLLRAGRCGPLRKLTFQVGSAEILNRVLRNRAVRQVEVMHLHNCPVAGAVIMMGDLAFPRLEALRMEGCTVQLRVLQAILDASPRLSALELHAVTLESPPQPCADLRCPNVTTLVLKDCSFPEDGVLLHAPKLRCFRYKGPVLPFSLQPPAPDLTSLDLTFSRPDESRLFWQFIRNFTNAKALKLRLSYLEDIADDDKNFDVLGNGMLPKLESLDLQTSYTLAPSTAPGVAIGNLLHCCPALRAMRLNLGAKESTSYQGSGLCQRRFVAKNDDRRGFSNSSRRSKIQISLDERVDLKYQLSNIPGLNGRSFSCLQSSLRYVAMKFKANKPNCFGVQLAKYFARNATLLQELHIDNTNLP